jgi:hypothetical protein
LNGIQEVSGSIPLSSTRLLQHSRRQGRRLLWFFREGLLGFSYEKKSLCCLGIELAFFRQQRLFWSRVRNDRNQEETIRK